MGSLQNSCLKLSEMYQLQIKMHECTWKLALVSIRPAFMMRLITVIPTLVALATFAFVREPDTIPGHFNRVKNAWLCTMMCSSYGANSWYLSSTAFFLEMGVL